MKTILISITLIFLMLNIKAADLIVEEFGPITSYSDISTAITAASPGDRIIIKNRFGQIPWIENIYINKSLSIISGQQDGTFLLDGNIIITPTLNTEVTIIGAEIFNGKNIYVSTGTITKRSMKVNVMSCKHHTTGLYIQLKNEGILATISGCDATLIDIAYGDVIGNKISKLAITNSQTTTSLNDTCYIVGNKITGAYSSTSTNKVNSSILFYEGGGEHLFVKNNTINNSGNRASYSHYIFAAYIDINEQNLTHKIYNNTISTNNTTYTGTTYPDRQAALYIKDGKAEIMNNLLSSKSSTSFRGYAINASSTDVVSAYFNYYSSNTNNSLNNDLNIITSSGILDKGNPAPIFTDINLSRNDLGETGGPYPIQNYFDNNNDPVSGSARVFHLVHPFFIPQGTSLNIKAKSYDR